MFGGLGQAVQPFLSANFSSGKYGRMRPFLHMAWMTCLFMELLFTAVGELFPELLIRLYTTPTDEVLALAPRMIRLYFLTYLFMGVSILCIYILQSTLQGGHAAILSLMRGLVLSGALILLLPLLFGLNGVMIAIVAAEAITAVTGLVMISKGTWAHAKDSNTAA
jgi:Na+-driven multidrug efflux pump